MAKCKKYMKGKQYEDQVVSTIHNSHRNERVPASAPSFQEYDFFNQSAFREPSAPQPQIFEIPLAPVITPDPTNLNTNNNYFFKPNNDNDGLPSYEQVVDINYQSR